MRAFYERGNKHENYEIVKTLSGTETYYCRCVGHCDFHHGYLTLKQLKGHECLKKNCDCLRVIFMHPFWIEREKTKELKKLKKAMGK